ncbi:MAG: sulfotransferase domain-containing protein, partial [Thermoleophilaceae bacterium]
MRSLRRRMRAAQEARERAEEALESAGGGRTGAVRRLFPQRSRGDGADRGALPDFLIIGAQKAGTSSLFRWLGESPGVELPEAKEVHFFDIQFKRGVDWYREQFPAGSSGTLGRRRTLTGEASPYYLFHPLAPERIREVLPEVRLLALLRDPVDRAVSHYYHELGNGFEDLPLAVALDREDERLAGEAERLRAEPGYVSHNHRHFSYQTRGVYADQLAFWRSVFPPEQLLAINSDRFFEDPRREMRRVHEFLDLGDEPAASLDAYNQRDYPSVPSEIRERLASHFSEPNARLETLLGEELGWQEAAAR